MMVRAPRAVDLVANSATVPAPGDLMSIRAIQKRIAGRASLGIVGGITKRARATQPHAL